MQSESIAISSGLTTAATPYASGDQMGTVLTFPNAVTFPGGTCLILGAVATDDSAVLGAFDLVLFNSLPTPAADNAAAAFSAADGQNCVGVMSFVAANLANIGGRIVGTFLPVSGGQPVRSADANRNLYGCMIARSANAVFAGGASSVRVKLYCEDLGQ